MNENNLISQSEAALLAGVSRQALNTMFKKKNGNYNFFTDSGKIDTSHQDWKSYLDDKTHKQKSEGMKSADNNPDAKRENKAGKKSGKEKEDGTGKKEASGWQREHALTGGFNPGGFYPTNPGQLKALTDVTRMNLEMRIKLGELIERNLFDSYIEKIAQGIMQLVNLGRSVSSGICQKLDRMGMEKEVEKIIARETKKIIEHIIDECNRAKTAKK